MIGNALRNSIIEVPFGREWESVASTRYSWDSEKRDKFPFVIVQWTFSGFGEMEFLDKVHEIPPAHLFIAIPPEKCRYYYPAHATQPWEFTWLNFYGGLGVDLWKALRTEFGVVVPMPRDSEAAALFVELTRAAVRREFKDQYEASSRAYQFYTTLIRQLAKPAPELSPVQRALQYLETASRSPVTVKELAALSGISREHFTRLFRQAQGCSPAEWSRLLRLEAAKSMIASSSAPLAEVALRCGFSSARHLRHAFRERYGVLPSNSR